MLVVTLFTLENHKVLAFSFIRRNIPLFQRKRKRERARARFLFYFDFSLSKSLKKQLIWIFKAHKHNFLPEQFFLWLKKSNFIVGKVKNRSTKLKDVLLFISLQLNFHNEKNKPITGANLLQRHSINSLLEQQDLIWSPNIDGKYGLRIIFLINYYFFFLARSLVILCHFIDVFRSKSKSNDTRLREHLCSLGYVWAISIVLLDSRFSFFFFRLYLSFAAILYQRFLLK